MMKIYGSMLCPDCVACCRELEAAGIAFEFCDFADAMENLKAFLKIRDKHPMFDEVRAAGKVGIPCIVCDDDGILLDWKVLLK